MMTLDGTLFVEDGVPYMVFCHEWVQIKNGTIEYVQLNPELSDTVGEPKKLFDGSDAPWARKDAPWGCYVTDGPWFYRTKTNRLLMLWSSFNAGNYTTGIAASKSGKLAGPWEQQAEPLYTQDGGHPMVFRAFDGRLMLTLHSPNNSPLTRQRLFELEDRGDTLRLKTR
jgi:arabinan endo-1,5-alpha-L-arabinosidase